MIPTPKELQIDKVFIITDVVFYSIVLLFAIYIIARFLVCEGKGNIVYVSSFYVFACITIVGRVANLMNAYFLISPALAEASDRISVFSKVFLELFQIAQMVELSIQIKVSAFKLLPKEALK